MKNPPDYVSELPLERLDLPVRAHNALKRRGVKTVGELLRLSDQDLLKLKNFGVKSLKDVRRSLSLHGRAMQGVAGESEQMDWAAQESPAKQTSEQFQKPLAATGQWKIPETIEGDLDAPIEVLDLSTRAANVLKRLGIKSIRQILDYPKRELFGAGNFGRKSMAELEAKVFACLAGKPPTGLDSQGIQSGREPSALGTKNFISNTLARLPDRERSIIADRYGLWDGIAETLQDIGDKFGLTRERIRQIEEKSLARLRRLFSRSAMEEFVGAKIRNHLSLDRMNNCGVLREDEAIAALADDCTYEEALLAVALLQDIDAPRGNLFSRILLDAEEGVLCVDSLTAAHYAKILELIEEVLEENKTALNMEDLCEKVITRWAQDAVPDPRALVRRIISVSPSVARLRNETVVLSRWSAFRRRDVASMAQASLMVIGRPAHFREITQKIGVLYPELGPPGENVVLGRLIAKQDKFVWVKSGTYGLKSWGLKNPPFIKDRLVQLFSEVHYPLSYWFLEEKVLEVCNCKEESVRMTLDLNPRLFKRFENDQYGLREHYEKRVSRE